MRERGSRRGGGGEGWREREEGKICAEHEGERGTGERSSRLKEGRERGEARGGEFGSIERQKTHKEGKHESIPAGQCRGLQKP